MVTIVPTSMGVRITPLNGQPVHCGVLFHAYSKCEKNVASVASFLGLPVKVLTTFVMDSPIARFIKDNLASRRYVLWGLRLNRAAGDTVISSILLTADSSPRTVFTTTGREKLAELLMSGILTSPNSLTEGAQILHMSLCRFIAGNR